MDDGILGDGYELNVVQKKIRQILGKCTDVKMTCETQVQQIGQNEFITVAQASS